MARMMIDCRDMPSESNCTLAIAGDDVEDLLDAAVMHATRFAPGSSPSRAPWPDHRRIP
jgi:hypothetical protein